MHIHTQAYVSTHKNTHRHTDTHTCTANKHNWPVTRVGISDHNFMAMPHSLPPLRIINGSVLTLKGPYNAGFQFAQWGGSQAEVVSLTPATRIRKWIEVLYHYEEQCQEVFTVPPTKQQSKTWNELTWSQMTFSIALLPMHWNLASISFPLFSLNSSSHISWYVCFISVIYLVSCFIILKI